MWLFFSLYVWVHVSSGRVTGSRLSVGHGSNPKSGFRWQKTTRRVVRVVGNGTLGLRKVGVKDIVISRGFPSQFPTGPLWEGRRRMSPGHERPFGPQSKGNLRTVGTDASGETPQCVPGPPVLFGVLRSRKGCPFPSGRLAGGRVGGV